MGERVFFMRRVASSDEIQRERKKQNRRKEPSFSHFFILRKMRWVSS